jgi:hypothetical protein
MGGVTVSFLPATAGEPSWPAFSTNSVGMLRTLKRVAVAGFSSTLSFATCTRPAISAAISSSTGAIIWHGPHHGAHRSSITGSGERSTSAANVASVTVTGLLETDRGVLHRPQTGLSPWLIFSCGTRLVAPQPGQRISWVSDIRLLPPTRALHEGIESIQSQCTV